MTTTPPPEESPALNSLNTASSTGRSRGRRDRLTARFLQAVGYEVGADDLTPAALTRAVVQVLPVDGAGMSILTGALRMPLGSSSDTVARAEELQTSLGEGPCLAAAEAQATTVVDAAELESRWPHYTEELTAQTAFRAVAAIPLRAPGHGIFAALDLYTTNPTLADRLDLTEIEQKLAAPAAALLSTCVEQIDHIEDPKTRPDWYQTAAGRRHDVWVAIGMVMANRPGRTRDALSLMRAHAYSQDRSLDDLAADVVNRQLPATDITDDDPPPE